MPAKIFAGVFLSVTMFFPVFQSRLELKGLTNWRWHKHEGAVVKPGFAGKHDQKLAKAPFVMEVGGGNYRMYYGCGSEEDKLAICLATALVNQPNHWHSYIGNPVFKPRDGEGFDNRGVDYPNIVRVSDKVWYMYYGGWGVWSSNGRIPNRTGLAISKDGGLTWQRHSPDPIIELGTRESWEADLTGSVFVLKEADGWRMWYTAGRYDQTPDGKERLNAQIGLALSKDGIRWTKYGGNPVLRARKEAADVFESVVSKPTILAEKGLYRLWYSHRGKAYRIGYAESQDGIHWNRWFGREGIDVSPQGWDSEMIEYAFVLPFKKGYRMWYTGNGFGATGIGYAEYVK